MIRGKDESHPLLQAVSAFALRAVVTVLGHA